MNVSQAALLETIEGLQPLDLKAVGLLRLRQAGLPLPSRDAIADATAELMAYAEECEKATASLQKLSPIPVTDPAFVEDYPL